MNYLIIQLSGTIKFYEVNTWTYLTSAAYSYFGVPYGFMKCFENQNVIGVYSAGYNANISYIHISEINTTSTNGSLNNTINGNLNSTNFTNLSSISNTSNISSVINARNISNFSNISNIINISNFSNLSNISSSSNISNVSNTSVNNSNNQPSNQPYNQTYNSTNNQTNNISNIITPPIILVPLNTSLINSTKRSDFPNSEHKH